MSEEVKKDVQDEELQAFLTDKNRKAAVSNMLNGDDKEVMTELYNNHGLKAMVDDDPSILDNDKTLAVAIKAAKQRMSSAIKAGAATEKTEQEKPAGSPAEQRGGAQLMADAEKARATFFIGDLTADEIAEKSNGKMTFGEAVFAKAFLAKN